MSFNLRSDTMSTVKREQTTIFQQALLDRGRLDIERIACYVVTCDRSLVGAILMYSGKAAGTGAASTCFEFQVNLWESHWVVTGA